MINVTLYDEGDRFKEMFLSNFIFDICFGVNIYVYLGKYFIDFMCYNVYLLFFK